MKDVPIGEDEEESAEGTSDELLPKQQEDLGQGDKKYKNLNEGILEGGQQLERGGVNIFMDWVGE